MKACEKVSLKHLLNEESLGFKELNVHDLQLGHILDKSTVVIDKILLIRPLIAISDCLLYPSCQLTIALGNLFDVGIMQEVIARLDTLKEGVHVSQSEFTHVLDYALQYVHSEDTKQLKLAEHVN